MNATGRFAPSPTGELHFGSLLSAVASYLQAKSAGGQWLIRIEDIDPPREVPGSAGRIIADLERFGMQSDREILYQSTRSAAYEQALDDLLATGHAYWCGCSRSEIPTSGIYPGTCKNGLPKGKSPRSVRLRVSDRIIRFHDRIQGLVEENLAQTVGDFVIRRADGFAAYQLAVVLDDAFQKVTEVVRGADLLDSTTRQIHLQQCLGLKTPVYAHHPVVTGSDDKKLGKRYGSDPIASLPPPHMLRQVLRVLGQPCPGQLALDKLWRWALDNWKLPKVPGQTNVPLDQTNAE
ncbi:tRNA glutamyl-Q(34) synthetase GluQRS [Pseudomonadota bacterium]